MGFYRQERKETTTITQGKLSSFIPAWHEIFYFF